MTIATIRKILRNAFGSRQYRITRDGEIHVHGVMPHSNVTGWYLFGYVGDKQTEAELNDFDQ